MSDEWQNPKAVETQDTRWSNEAKATSVRSCSDRGATRRPFLRVDEESGPRGNAGWETESPGLPSVLSLPRELEIPFLKGAAP